MNRIIVVNNAQQRYRIILFGSRYALGEAGKGDRLTASSKLAETRNMTPRFLETTEERMSMSNIPNHSQSHPTRLVSQDPYLLSAFVCGPYAVDAVAAVDGRAVS